MLPPPLLAQDVSNPHVALLVAGASLLSAGLTAVANWFISWQAAKRKAAKEDEKTIVDHLQALVERQRQDIAGLHEEVEQLRGEQAQQQAVLVREQLRGERLLGHVRHLEALMRGRRIQFEPFEPGSGHEIPAAGAGPAKPPTGGPDRDG